MEQRLKKLSRIIFLIGVMIIIIAALMMFCQERCFLRTDLESWPAVLGIIGISLMSSGIGLMNFSKCKPLK